MKNLIKEMENSRKPSKRTEIKKNKEKMVEKYFKFDACMFVWIAKELEWLKQFEREEIDSV